MDYTGIVELEHHIEARQLLSPSKRARIWLRVIFYLCIAGGLAWALSGAVDELAIAVEKERLGEALRFLQEKGFGWLLWLTLVAVPLALYLIFVSIGDVLFLSLPLEWQPWVHGRMRHKGFLGHFIYTFAGNELQVLRYDGTMKSYPWHEVIGFKETRRGFYLIRERAPNVIVPKPEWNKPSQINAVRAELKRHLQAI